MNLFSCIAWLFERAHARAWRKFMRTHTCRVANVPRGMQFHHWHQTVGERICPFCSDCATEHAC